MENAGSVLGAASLVQKGNGIFFIFEWKTYYFVAYNITDDSNVPKEENEKIPLEVQEYMENIELENQVQKETIESLKKPLVYAEKFMVHYEKLKAESENLKVKNQELEDARLCRVCMEVEICFVFIPCGHQCTCENCAVNGDLKNCPICREKITKRIKTFLP